MKKILFATLIALIIFFAFFAGATEHEKYECEKWQTESETYTNYYFIDWQKEQCKKYGYDFH